jgi:hypothetical protein
MSLIVGFPFRDGIVVAGDKAYIAADSVVRYGASKLSLAGGVLFSLSGQAEIMAPGGRRVFSLQHVVASAAPEKLEVQHLQSIAQSSGEAMGRMSARGCGEGCQAIFWFPTTIADCLISPSGPSRVSTHKLEPLRPATIVLQGRAEVEAMVVRGGKLSAKSSSWLRGRPLIRDVSLEDATAFVIDVQEAAARTLPQWIGGGIDLRVVSRDGVAVVKHDAQN